jgi:nucleoside-diphosphate-sugar epimerase
MKVLFIGGTGIISSACSQLAVERGYELYLLNRGQTTKRPAPAGAVVLNGDIRDPARGAGRSQVRCGRGLDRLYARSDRG